MDTEVDGVAGEVASGPVPANRRIRLVTIRAKNCCPPLTFQHGSAYVSPVNRRCGAAFGWPAKTLPVGVEVTRDEIHRAPRPGMELRAHRRRAGGCQKHPRRVEPQVPLRTQQPPRHRTGRPPEPHPGLGPEPGREPGREARARGSGVAQARPHPGPHLPGSIPRRSHRVGEDPVSLPGSQPKTGTPDWAAELSADASA